jgi:hypothetical protein
MPALRMITLMIIITGIITTMITMMITTIITMGTRTLMTIITTGMKLQPGATPMLRNRRS